MKSVVWKRIDVPGHEHCRLGTNRIEGVAVVAYDGRPCRVEYSIDCDAEWRTRLLRVHAYVGQEELRQTIECEEGRWTVNRVAQPQVDGCIDVDLQFSPSTNTLPIRRHALKVGEKADVAAAWLRFPTFKLERLEQSYERTGEETYRYASRGGSFTAELEVDELGLVRRYGDLWIAEV